MNLLREKQRCLAMHGAAYSDSEAQTTNKTEVTDARVVGGNDSSNVSANSGSNVTLITTDHNAVTGGLQLGSQAIDAATRDAQGVQETTKSIYADTLDAARGFFADGLSFVKDANARSEAAYADAGGSLASAYANQASNLATAFTDSKAPDKSLLMVAGVIVVGLAGVMVLAKKG